MTYIVESPTRGVLVEQDWVTWDKDWRTKFSYVTRRGDAYQFTTLQAAMTAVSRLTRMQAKGVNILEYGTWEVVS